MSHPPSVAHSAHLPVWVLSALLFSACSTTSRTMSDADSAVDRGPRLELGASSLLTQGPEVFSRACRTDLDAARALRGKLVALDGKKQPAELLTTYDALMSHVQLAGSRASVARNAHPEAAIRDAADACEKEAETLASELSLDRGLYDALASVDLEPLDATTRHWVERELASLRRAGVDRDEATRARIQALKEELIQISQDFGRNIREDVRTVELDPAQLAGLPEDYVAAHPPGADGKVRITSDYPDYVPFMVYAKDAAAREAVWRAYRMRGHPQNVEVLQKLVDKRQELATLLGFPHWAALVTDDKMVKTAEAADAFIKQVTEATRVPAEREMAELLALKQQDVPGATRVEPWDQAFYEDRLKAAKFDFDSQEIRPYLEYERVLSGVLDVTGHLFGIRYQPVNDAAVWHPDVRVYDVVDTAQDAVLGRIYLDMHPRGDKYKHAAQFDLVNGQAGKRLPEGVLLCNFPRPGGDAPALMQPTEVETFFHEFGHLLHHIFAGHLKWNAQSGIKTEWDFVEAPSMLLQEWGANAESLSRFATHHETGAPLPVELVERMTAAKEFGKGLYTRRQMFLSAVSLHMYDQPEGVDPHRVVESLQPQFEPFRREHDGDTRFELSFGHLDGYSAIYYTYMWSSVIARDLLTVFEAEGMMNPAPAQRYRRAILAAGGSKDAADLVEDFLGRPYTFDAYARWLSEPPAQASSTSSTQ